MQHRALEHMCTYFCLASLCGGEICEKLEGPTAGHMRSRDLFSARQGIALFRSAACSQAFKPNGTSPCRERQKLRRDKICSLSSCRPFYYCRYYHHHHHHTTTLSKSSRRSLTNTGGLSSPEAAVGVCACSFNSMHPVLAKYVNIVRI